MHTRAFKSQSYLLLILIILCISGCSGSRRIETQDGPAPSEAPAAGIETEQAAAVPASSDSTSPPPLQVLYQDREGFQEPVSDYDVLHTSIDISFDFSEQQVLGFALHRLRVTSSETNLLHFHGKDMEIHEVSVKRGDAEFRQTPFRYENDDIRISLTERVIRDDTIEVRISYTANPMRNGRRLGLVFVDPLEVDLSRPTQVWTLGQPEDNRYWFPAWDYPNDRMTFDLFLTVPQKFTTIGNGQLVEQKVLPGGLRKDHWSLAKPHPTYLTGFAVGEYAAVVDSYERRDGSNVPLAYFVEPDHAVHAALNFGETPEMMRFFESKLGIAYPWSNYKQIAVRDFTARGMENTTATIMYDALQHDDRAHLDYTGRDLITHELAHQWFGNLLTCRNWAHLPLNEGFASYFERLFLEEAHGLDAAQYHTIEDRTSYLEEAKTMQRPVIWYGYEDPNVLYDRHTYQKAALVLHQLRYELGDEVWWKGIRQYVRENAFRQVVLEDLQQAMEQAAGKGLKGFFDQWYRRPGHPVLDVRHSYDQSRGIYDLHVSQLQDSIKIGNFAFDVQIEVNVNGVPPFIHRYRVASRDTTYRFAIASTISFVRFNAGDWLLADINVQKDVSEWISQIQRDDEMAGRYDAAKALALQEPERAIRDVFLKVLKEDPSKYVREAVAAGLGAYNEDPEVRQSLAESILNDSESNVRLAALTTLDGMRDVHLRRALNSAILDRSYMVVAEAVRIYASAFPDDAVRAVRPLFDIVSWRNVVERSVLEAYENLKSIEGIPYIQRHISPVNSVDVQIAGLEALSAIALAHSEVRSSVSGMIMESLSSVHEPVRYSAARALRPLMDSGMRSEIRGYLEREQSQRVKRLLQDLISN